MAAVLEDNMELDISIQAEDDLMFLFILMCIFNLSGQGQLLSKDEYKGGEGGKNKMSAVEFGFRASNRSLMRRRFHHHLSVKTRVCVSWRKKRGEK